MTEQKQIIIILSLAVLLGLLRSFFLDDPEFTLIKQERVIEQVSSFLVPDDITGPMLVNLEFAKYHFDAKTAVFISFKNFFFFIQIVIAIHFRIRFVDEYG